MNRKDQVSNQVMRLVRENPELAEIGNRNRLLFCYWKEYDNLHVDYQTYYISNKNIPGLTSSESITRALRKLITDGKVKPSNESVVKSVTLENEYREFYRQ